MAQIEIKYEVKRIIYRNEKTGYTIMNVDLKKHPKEVEIPTSDVVITGNFNAVHNKDEFISKGEWVDTGANGFQFASDTSSLVFPETSKGMVEFLMRCVNGVGRVIAKRVVETFIEDTFHVIMYQPEKLLSIRGLTEKKAKEIHNSISQHKEFEEVALFLLPMGISHTDAVVIYEELGFGAIEKVTENPYILALYGHFRFRTMDELALKLGLSFNNPERIKQSILLYINTMMKNRGDMFSYRRSIERDLDEFLAQYGAFPVIEEIGIEAIDVGIEALRGMGKIKIEYTKSGKVCVYLSYFHHIENKIVEKIKTIISSMARWICSKDDLDEFIRKYELKSGLTLASQQKEATRMALFNRLSILSGGPGTGKTQTINTIIEAIKYFAPNSTIELCAPTGRAAKRMTELTNMEAKTIHRLIGLQSTEQDIKELIPVDADFLIIDESSMIDAHVFHSLLSVVSEETRILIVGDYEQLPSVGPGLILRDLIASDVVPTTILTEIFRQAKTSQIVMNCHKLNHGKKTTDIDGLQFEVKKKDFYFIEDKNVERISSLIIKSVDRLRSTGFALDDIQVLSVMNKGDLGTIELNRKIQGTFNPKRKFLDEIEVGANRYLRVNDRVMQTQNNYDLKVFNGEVGKILSMDFNSVNSGDGFELVVDFGDREVAYTNEFVSQLALAYAITVHKAQGSEFKAVIMPFHSSLSILLSRNIIYTAWSRAKTRVVCIGSKEELNKGVDRTENTVRNSQIKEKLMLQSRKVVDAA